MIWVWYVNLYGKEYCKNTFLMRYTMTLSFAVMVVFWEWGAQISYSFPGSAGDHWRLLHSPLPPLSLRGYIQWDHHPWLLCWSLTCSFLHARKLHCSLGLQLPEVLWQRYNALTYSRICKIETPPSHGTAKLPQPGCCEKQLCFSLVPMAWYFHFSESWVVSIAITNAN